MKKLLLITLCFPFLFSCQRNVEQLKPSSFENNYQLLSKKPSVEQGMLSFTDLKHFTNTLSELSDSDTKLVTDEMLDTWEKELGFISLRHEYKQAVKAFENIKSLSEIADIKAKYPEFIYTENELPALNIESEVLASVLDVQHRVKIGGVLHAFSDKKQIIILDGDNQKLEKATKTLQTEENNGIYVLDRIIESRANCGTSRSCAKTSGSKRVNASWVVSSTTNPNTAIPGAMYGWDIAIHYTTKSASEKKNWLGVWVNNSSDQITFASDYNIQYQKLDLNAVPIPPLGPSTTVMVNVANNVSITATTFGLSNYLTVASYSYPPSANALSPNAVFTKNLCSISNNSTSSCNCNDNCQ